MASANEVGTMFGGFILGFISDRCYSKRAPVGAAAVILASSILGILTVSYSALSSAVLAICFFFIGLLIGGLHHILCITCAADLGQHKARTSDKHATSAVTGIIDGLGSLGTAIGQLVIGFTASEFGWRWGYLFVITLVTLGTLIPLWRLLVKDLRDIKAIRAKKYEEVSE